MTKPRQLEMHNIRKVIPPQWNCKFTGDPYEQDYFFTSSFRPTFGIRMTASKKRNTVIVSKERWLIDEETGEEYTSYETLFTTTFKHLSNALHYVKKMCK